MLGLTLSKTPPPPPPTAPANPLLMQRPGDCELLGSFALFVQLALGALAMMSLVWKRYRERPQRPVKIWFFDVSKQVFGSAMVHAANVFMAMLTSGRFSVKLTPRSVASVAGLMGRAAETIAEGKGKDVYQPNPCSWYLLNLAVDTTLGIPVLILLIRFYTFLVSLTPLGRPSQSIESGNYGSPPKATWWLKQSIIYFCSLFGMKVVVLIFFILCPWISHIGDWALRWTEGDEELQIVFVMMLFPLIMNAMQYYVIDSFIKKQTGHSSSDSDDRGHHTRLPDSEDGISSDDSDSDAESITDQDEAKALVSPSSDRRSFKSSTSDTPKTAEYDPAVDGDAPTLFGSSSSQTQIEGVLPSR